MAWGEEFENMVRQLNIKYRMAKTNKITRAHLELTQQLTVAQAEKWFLFDWSWCRDGMMMTARGEREVICFWLAFEKLWDNIQNCKNTRAPSKKGRHTKWKTCTADSVYILTPAWLLNWSKYLWLARAARCGGSIVRCQVASLSVVTDWFGRVVVSCPRRDQGR